MAVRTSTPFSAISRFPAGLKRERERKKERERERKRQREKEGIYQMNTLDRCGKKKRR
jgi:hypothetical protein